MVCFDVALGCPLSCAYRQRITIDSVAGVIAQHGCFSVGPCGRRYLMHHVTLCSRSTHLPRPQPQQLRLLQPQQQPSAWPAPLGCGPTPGRQHSGAAWYLPPDAASAGRLQALRQRCTKRFMQRS